MEWFELACRWILGLQFLFWGLNGFFHWTAIPPTGDFIPRFNDICTESKFIMPTVKIIEVLFGAVLLTGFGSTLALIFLGPVVFVITGLHLLHNPKWWIIPGMITVPYIALLVLHEQQWQFLLH